MLLARSSSCSWLLTYSWGPFSTSAMNLVISTVRVIRDFVSLISSVLITKSLTLNYSGITLLRLCSFLLMLSSESSLVDTSRATFFSSCTSTTSTLK